MGSREFLNLRDIEQRIALRQLDWKLITPLIRHWRLESIPRCKAYRLDVIFRKTICNERACPLGWEWCRREDYTSCYYYELLRAVASWKC